MCIRDRIYHTFPDRREGSKSSLILKRTKTKKSNRILYMTKPLKAVSYTHLTYLPAHRVQLNRNCAGSGEVQRRHAYDECPQKFR